MPRTATKNLKDKAAYWAYSGVDDYGNITVSAAVEIDVFWNQTVTQLIQPDGKRVRVDGQVFCAIDLSEKGLLWHGNLADVPVSFNNDLMEIAFFAKVPDIKSRKYTRYVGIRRYKDTLPTVA